jgi:hypothetical protein
MKHPPAILLLSALGLATLSAAGAGDLAAINKAPAGARQWPAAAPLFARDLSNITPAAGTGAWSCKDGVFTGKGIAWTKTAYGNFYLSLEFRALEKAGGGIFLRCSDTGDFVQNSLEVRLLQGDHPSGDERAIVGALHDLAKPSRQVEIKPGAWHKLLVAAENEKITVWLDNECLVQADLDFWDTPGKNPDGTGNKFTRPIRDFARSGAIGLHAADGKIKFRNLYIDTLPATPQKPPASSSVPFASVTYLPPDTPAAATEDWETKVPVITVPAGTGIPSDATVLFDGSSLAAWESTNPKETSPQWKVGGGILTPVDKTGGLRTKTAHGDVQVHLEFRTPAAPAKRGQYRGNSGLLFMGLYEFQVLDSYDNPTYANGQAASIYKQHPPLVNASRAPGEWQTCDVIFTAPRFAAGGALLSPARITAFHNGGLVQHDAVLTGPTAYRGRLPYAAHAARLPLVLQNHPAERPSFRNIWLRDLAPAK